jgi:uncharacterized protein (TIGR00375 family)
MKVIADLHIHSRFSRACSKSITIKNLEKFARIKGLNLLGTGDFTFPAWLEELKGELSDDGSGILKTKTGFRFILQTELSNIYKQDGKQRRIHNIILAPGFEVVEQINEQLLKYGRLDYDGRPIFGFNCVELVEMLKNIDKRIEIIPAHMWTSWFSLFGSKSGFDSVEECFGDQTKHINALETGLSSNPAMNWRLSQLDEYSLVSFSDAHTYFPWRVGREATVFSFKKFSYENVIKALRTKRGLVETLEFFPEEGKYHFDGHRACNVCLSPKGSIAKGNRCPKCGRELTIGVLHRVEELADREEGYKPDGAVPFKSLIPLSEIISYRLGIESPYSKKVWEQYNKLIKAFGNELNVLLEVPLEKLKEMVHEKVAEAITKVREGKVKFKPGYDGVYGKPVFGFERDDKEAAPEIKEKQMGLLNFEEEVGLREKRQKKLTDF